MHNYLNKRLFFAIVLIDQQKEEGCTLSSTTKERQWRFGADTILLHDGQPTQTLLKRDIQIVEHLKLCRQSKLFFMFFLSIVMIKLITMFFVSSSSSKNNLKMDLEMLKRNQGEKANIETKPITMFSFLEYPSSSRSTKSHKVQIDRQRERERGTKKIH